MPVEVSNSIVIDRPRDVVAAYATEPDNAPHWYVNIKSIEWKTPRPLAVGSRLAFVARFLGRRLAYTYEVAELEPGTRFVMRTAQGPFPMETTYERADAGEGKTEMTLRNGGQPSGFSSLAAPVMAGAIDRANKRDLQAIKRIIESR